MPSSYSLLYCQFVWYLRWNYFLICLIGFSLKKNCLVYTLHVQERLTRKTLLIMSCFSIEWNELLKNLSCEYWRKRLYCMRTYNFCYIQVLNCYFIIIASLSSWPWRHYRWLDNLLLLSLSHCFETLSGQCWTACLSVLGYCACISLFTWLFFSPLFAPCFAKLFWQALMIVRCVQTISVCIFSQ